MIAAACTLLPLVQPTGTQTPIEVTPLVVTPAEPGETLEPTSTEAPPVVNTQVVEITPDSQVRRLNASVFAGQAQPLSELVNDELFGLDPGGLVSTNRDGEAEINIQGCLKLFVFQDSELTRSTCRREDAQSGLGVCGTAGMTGVINNCTAQVNVQSPSAAVGTTGTWFTVIYLPADQLSIVQVYEGNVSVQAVTDMGTGETTDPLVLDQGSLWFSQPGGEPPNINGIDGRLDQPMEVWEALRPALIDRYPNLDRWMQSAQDQAQVNNQPFPESLVLPAGEVTFHFSGLVWTDERLQEAVQVGIPWGQMMRDLWPDRAVTPRIEFPNQVVVEDARGRDLDTDTASRLFSEAGFYDLSPVSVAVLQGDGYSTSAFFVLQPSFETLKKSAELFEMTDEDLQIAIRDSQSRYDAPFIWISAEGEAFQ